MDRIEQHIHDTVNDIDREANMGNYGYKEAFGNDNDDPPINPAYDTSDMTPEEKAEFEKAMDEYDDRGLGCRPDMMDDDCDIQGRFLG